MSQQIFIVGRTFFYNKTQDAATSKTILDVRSRDEYDKNHVRASFSTPIVDDYHQFGAEEGVVISSRELLESLLNNFHINASTNLGANGVEEITKVLNELYGRVSLFRLRGLGYKSVLLYGDEEIVLNELKSGVEKVGEDVKFPNCDQLVEPSSRIVGHVHLDDTKKYTVLLLAELLKKEGKIENVYVLDSYKSYLEKYSHVITFKDRIGHQALYPTEIIENFLYLGNRENASSDRELTDIGITYILNMAEEVENVLEEMILDNGENKYKYLKLGTGDTIEHSISDLFEQANQFLREAYENNCKAIVNCNMGVSRSSTTVISYLMKYYGLSFERAFNHAKGHRSITCPNLSFREQLKNFYKH